MIFSHNYAANSTFTIIRPLTWIVSYPRSGNMFLRCLLANYVSGIDRPLSLNEVVESSYGEHDEILLQELTGKSPVERSLEEELAIRPEYVRRTRARAISKTTMMKSHTVFGEINGVKAFDFAACDRIIHIVRHPCDVAISMAKYYNFSLDESIRRMQRDGTFYHGVPDYGYEVIGSWAQHTRSWLQEIGTPKAHIFYDDLLSNPIEVMLDLAEFLGLEKDQARAEMAVEFSGFDRLKSEETAKGFIERAEGSQDGYFRSGQGGQWQNVLSQGQANAILNHDPKLIKSLGYAPQKQPLTPAEQPSLAA